MANLPLAECDALSAAEFRRRWSDTATPVVRRGLVRSWPACTAWSPSSLALRFGAVPVQAMCTAVDELRGTNPYYETLKISLTDLVVGCDPYLVAQSCLLPEPPFDSLWSGIEMAPEWFDLSVRSTHISFA